MKLIVNTVRKLKQRLGPLWWHSMLMFLASRFGDFIGLYIGMFLVPAVLAPEKLGAVLPLLKFSAVVAVPMNIVARTAMKYINTMLVREEHGRIKSLLRDLTLLTSGISIFIILVLSIGWRFIERRLKIQDDRILWLIVISVIMACWTPLAQFMSQGLKHFNRIILARLLSPISRLIVILLVLKQLQIVGYLSANVIVSLVSLLLLGDGLLRYLRRDIMAESYRDLLPDMLNYAKPVATVTLMVAVQLAAGPWIIRQRLPETVSAGYYIAAMFGNIPLWVAPAMLPFLFPLVSEHHEKGVSTTKMHIQALGAVLFAGAGISLILFIFGGRILQLRPAWNEYSEYAVYMWQIALITTMDTLFFCHVTHDSACKRFRFLSYYVPLVVIEVILLGILMGWSHFSGVMPEALWQLIGRKIPVDLHSVLCIMITMRCLNSIFLFADMLRSYAVVKNKV
jgi:O-antigen/teichoic acid export membrane protein